MSLLTSDYVADWYLLKHKKPFTSLTDTDEFYLLKSITNNTSIAAIPIDLIQGEAGVLVIDQQQHRDVTTISSEALILNNSSGVNNVETNIKKYYDIIDLLKKDYYALLMHFFLTPEDLFIKNSNTQLLGIALSEFGEAIKNYNLLSSADISLGEIISANLTYQTRYDKKFEVIFADELKDDPGEHDFIARIARNYDCRFYIDGTNYLIKSGSINISIDYQELWFANSFSKLPFYSPQKHSVSGTMEIIAVHDDIQSIKTSGNCSVLIGNRYIELGQASIKTNYQRSLQASNAPTTITINFQAYARLGAGLDDIRWTTYFINALNNPNKQLYDGLTLQDIINNFLKNPDYWVDKP